MGKVKSLELERMFQAEEFARLNMENEQALCKGTINPLEFEIVRSRILFEYGKIMDTIEAEAKINNNPSKDMAWQGNESFPSPSDMDSKYVNGVPEESVGNLLTHLRMSLDKVLAPQNSKERMYSLHLLRLIDITRARVEALSIIKLANGKQERKEG